MKFVLRAKKYLEGRNSPLFKLFATYLGLIVLFSIIYLVDYSRRPGDFVFNADVLKAQSENYRLPLEREIERSAEQLRALTALSQQLNLANDESVSVREGQVTFDTSTYRYAFYIAGGDLVDLLPLGLPIGPDSALLLSIRNTDGGVIGTLESVSPARLTDEVQQYKRLTAEFTEQAERVLDSQRRRLQTLTSSYADVWSFWDFLYFSTITQTTVGYGDILPNSTVVRMLVVVQVILGLTIIGVLINIVSSNFRGTAETSSNSPNTQFVVTSSRTEEKHGDAREIDPFTDAPRGSSNDDGLDAQLPQKPARILKKKSGRSRPHRRR